MAMGALFMLPGIPVVQYGTEIAMNGEAKPDTHQLYNFKTDEELIDYIKMSNLYAINQLLCVMGILKSLQMKMAFLSLHVLLTKKSG